MLDVDRISQQGSKSGPGWIGIKNISPIEAWPSNLHRIAIVGIGNAGINSVSLLASHNIRGARLIAIDKYVDNIAHLGTFPVAENLPSSQEYLINGLQNRQNNPNISLQFQRTLIDALSGSQVVFITAGMGGDTGTTVAPLVAEIAHNIGAFVISMITTPFNFEGPRRLGKAITGVAHLNEKSNSIVEINSERLLVNTATLARISESFYMADTVVSTGLSKTAGLLNHPNFPVRGLTDFCQIMSYPGAVSLAIGNGNGKRAVVDAVDQALTNPLLNLPIERAHGLIFHITCTSNAYEDSDSTIPNMIATKLGRKLKSLGTVTVDDNVSPDSNVILLATGI